MPNECSTRLFGWLSSFFPISSFYHFTLTRDVFSSPPNPEHYCFLLPHLDLYVNSILPDRGLISSSVQPTVDTTSFSAALQFVNLFSFSHPHQSLHTCFLPISVSTITFFRSRPMHTPASIPPWFVHLAFFFHFDPVHTIYSAAPSFVKLSFPAPLFVHLFSSTRPWFSHLLPPHPSLYACFLPTYPISDSFFCSDQVRKQITLFYMAVFFR